MNWIRNNPFLAGLAGVLVVCTGVLGFLIFSASSKYSEVSGTYKSQAGELRRLQNLAPYPEQANFEKLKKQKDAYVSAVAGVVDSVAGMQLQVEPLSPEQFQDELKAAVTAASTRAQQNGTQLPDKFYLGFDSYQALPPKPEAAPLLGRQLRAIEMAMGIILNARLPGITAIRRAPLPVEEARPASALNSGAMKSDKAVPSKNKLAGAAPFEVDLQVEQSQLRAILNGLATEQKQLFVVRSLHIANENQKGPLRADTQTAAAPAPPPPDQAVADGGATPASAALKFIVGGEKLLVSLKIDVMEFTLPKTGTGK